MAVLVTGATGTVGSAVVRALTAKGVAVRAGIHTADKADLVAHPLVEVVTFDPDTPESLRPAMHGIERMFLLTVATENMPDLNARVVDAARDEGVRHIVKLSGLGADDQTTLTLNKIHRAAEKQIEASGIAWTFLRPNSFMQNFTRYYRDVIRAQGAFFLPQGNGRVSHVDVRDVAEIAVKALTEFGHEGKVYSLTGPAALTNHEVAQHLSKGIGRRISYVNVPDLLATEAMKGMGLSPWLIRALMEVNRMNRDGGAATVTNDVEAVLGRPATSFAQFSTDHASVFARA